MDELHEQTVNLLSFQQLPKIVFEPQVAFNLRGWLWPEGSGPGLSVIEEPRCGPAYRGMISASERAFTDTFASSRLPRAHLFDLH